MEAKIVYFDQVTAENTETTFRLVKERLAASKIKKIVLASTTGETASVVFPQ